jgi:hypothetical protein
VAIAPGTPGGPDDLHIDDIQPHPQLQERRLLVQEHARLWIAVGLIGILALTILGAFIGAFSSNWTNVKDLLQLLLPAETALLGGALGFYFGSDKQR